MMRSNSLIDEVSQDLSQMNIGSYWNTDVANSTDILHRQSINSLLSGGNAGHVSPQEGDTLNVTELFGLNKPRSTTLSSSCGGSEANVVGSPPKERFYTEKLSASIRTTPQSGWVDNSFSSPSTPPRYDMNMNGDGTNGFPQCNLSKGFTLDNNNTCIDFAALFCDDARDKPFQKYTSDHLVTDDRSGASSSTMWNQYSGALRSSALVLQNDDNADREIQLPAGKLSDEDDKRLQRYRLLDRFMQLTDSTLDQKVMFHRSAASWYEATCTWSGLLPKRPLISLDVNFASKVFLGGVPWDITEDQLVSTFSRFGRVQVEWPGKERRSVQPKGHIYLTFESQYQVKRLLTSCNSEINPNNGDEKWFFRFSSPSSKRKQMQVIPWMLSEAVYTKNGNQYQFDPNKTVFVGAVHGTVNAEGLAKIMNDLFDGVVAVGLDTDRWKYPMGSARVSFNNIHSYKKAVNAAFVQIKTDRISKKIQVDPYLEESTCTRCGEFRGLYFCRDLTCFRYYCCICWKIFHIDLDNHKPIAKRLRQSVSII